MLIFIDLCSMFEAGALGHVPATNFGRESAKNKEKLKYIVEFPVLSLSKLKIRGMGPLGPHPLVGCLKSKRYGTSGAAVAQSYSND